MNGNIQNFCQHVMRVMFRAYHYSLNSRYGENLNEVKYGKLDTLGLDSIPEIMYINDLKRYDPDVVFVSEETDEQTLAALPDTANPKSQPIILISDPIDRSKYIKAYLEVLFKAHHEKNPGIELDVLKCVTVKELMNCYGSIPLWEKMSGAPASITGATSSITCINKGHIVFTVIVNYISGFLCTSSEAGIFHLDLLNIKNESEIVLEKVFNKKHLLSFLESQSMSDTKTFDDQKRFTTFLGKKGYRENFDQSMIFMEKEDIEPHLHYKEPGGPSRILYLSELQEGHAPLGFIMYNGEKITEWIHGLCFVKFAKNFNGGRALQVYEISTDHSMSKEGIHMSTHPAYSIFNKRNGQPFIDINKLKDFDSPSHYRSMLVMAPSDNDWIRGVMAQHGYRDIGDCL